MAEKEKAVLPILNQAQRATLEGVSNRRAQLPSDTTRDELAELGLVVKQGAKWALTPKGKKVLSLSSSKRNLGGFRP
ncbi:hypothetical protein [Sphingopyxis yananensis]|uniref:hypothetical protein n=1 Tax=Sphingopyxis yananensis TaxID=2886687 RepID=UPI001D0FA181|nr:hypothetical protein [Sphingopyxis yananensis]MCC2601928.1 hypothetical protein [Sphingopyxis yananensis]